MKRAEIDCGDLQVGVEVDSALSVILVICSDLGRSLDSNTPASGLTFRSSPVKEPLVPETSLQFPHSPTTRRSTAYPTQTM